MKNCTNQLFFTFDRSSRLKNGLKNKGKNTENYFSQKISN